MSEGSAPSSTFVAGGGAQAYENLMGRWSCRLAGPFLDFAGLGEGERVLDVGCGNGSLTFAIAERPVAAVTGIDLTEAYVAYARERNRDGRVTLEAGDACALPYDDASFDRALSMLVTLAAKADLAAAVIDDPLRPE